jgi:nucleoside-diphosphate-sugar epimerase
MPLHRLFITGINGTIGTILRRGLAASFDIYGLDRVGPFSDRVLKADVRAYEEISSAFRKASPFPYLIHLAADVRFRASWESVLTNNIVGTYNAFEAARKLGVKRVVYASSNHVTGAYHRLGGRLRLSIQQEPPLISVRDPVRPDSLYAVSKSFGEALAGYYSARWRMQFVCLRIGTVLREDDPTTHPRHRKTWLSHRDLLQLTEKSLASNVVFGIYYGVSANRGALWDISSARQDLGYEPEDDASRR